MKITEKINRSRYTLKEILSFEWNTDEMPDYSTKEILWNIGNPDFMSEVFFDDSFDFSHQHSVQVTNDKNIINIGSNSVRTLNASNMIYIACKSAIESLTKSFAKHYGEFVRVNCVNPGLVKSYLSKDFFDDRKKYVISKTPIKKLTTPNDIAEIVFNIVTNIKMLNGQCIDVDGGRTL